MPCTCSEPFASSSSGLTLARYSTTVLLEADAGSREDTVGHWQTVLLEADAGSRERHCWTLAEQSYTCYYLTRCMQCMGKAIITSFTPFDPAPCDKKSRSEHQTLFPLFGEGSGHKTMLKGGLGTRLCKWLTKSVVL